MVVEKSASSLLTCWPFPIRGVSVNIACLSNRPGLDPPGPQFRDLEHNCGNGAWSPPLMCGLLAASGLCKESHIWVNDARIRDVLAFQLCRNTYMEAQLKQEVDDLLAGVFG